MKTLPIMVLFIASAAVMVGQQQVPLWPAPAPGSLGTADQDQPTIAPCALNGGSYSQKNRTAVVVFPGGGYAALAVDHEGAQVAAWLNSYGITAFVVRYRLGPRYHHPVQLGDAQRAIRWVRAHALEYGIDSGQVGIWGFSAGGHLASTAETHFDAGKMESPDAIERQSSRPSFAILGYPVVTMRDPYVHKGSRTMLLGDHPKREQIDDLSNELHVTKDTPPTFIFHTADDPVVPVENSLSFYLALCKAGVPAELHIFQHGKHGVGLARDMPGLEQWPDLLADWLKQNHWR